MEGRRAAVAPVLALAMVAAAVTKSAAPGAAEKCGGCTPCVGADCPAVYTSSPPPPPPFYYYSPPPPASYPGGSAGYLPPPGAYSQIGGTPSGKGPLYPQDPGFLPSAAPRRAVAASVAAFAALVGAWAFL